MIGLKSRKVVFSASIMGGVFVLASVMNSNAGDAPKQDDGQSAHFVKIRRYYFNSAYIQYATDDGKTSVVVFGPGAENRVALSEADAEAMRDWLNVQASVRYDINVPRRGPPIQSSNGGNIAKPPPESPTPTRPAPDGDGPKVHFVKIRHYYFNPTYIQYVADDEKTLIVVFGPGAENRVTLNGPDAGAMHDWLDVQTSVSHDVNAPPRGDPLVGGPGAGPNSEIAAKPPSGLPTRPGSASDYDGPKAHLVKIRHYYFNFTYIQYVADDEKTLIVVFGPGAENRVTLNGPDAEAMRSWLTVQASVRYDINGPRRGAPTPHPGSRKGDPIP